MDEGEPLISIIITCYNYEKYVTAAIKSALSQRDVAFEVIVVDDGSTDESWKKISSFGYAVKSIRTLNKGSIAACMTGFNMSTGTFVIFLDADDMLSEGALSEVSKHMVSGVSKLQFMLQPIDCNGAHIGSPYPKYDQDISNETLIKRIGRHGAYASPPTSGNIYSRDVYEKIGRIDYDWGIDGVAYLLAPFVGEVITIRRALGSYRIHGSNMTSVKKLTSARLVLEKTVFLIRTQHLAKLLSEHGLATHGFEAQKTYLYVVEREVYISIMNKQRIAPTLKSRYIERINSEKNGNARKLYLIYASLIMTLPLNIALFVILARIDLNKFTLARRFIKLFLNVK